MLRKILTVCVVLGSFYFSNAQSNNVAIVKADTSASLAAKAAPEEQKPKTVISGSVDVYYRYDFSKQASNNKTSFTNSHNSFELGMASLRFEHNIGKVGMVADLGFGKRVEEFSYNDAGTRQAIKQLYVTYSPTKDLKFTAGTWATHFDWEVLDPYGNRNYSMSYMFTFGPFSHTGVKAELAAGKSGFMLGVANPNDYRSFNNASKTVIAQYTYAPTDKFKGYINYFTGKRPSDSAKISQLELVMSQKFSDKFNMDYCGSICFNKTQVGGKYANSKNWWCSGLYFNYDPTSIFGLTLRSEYFSDENQQNVFAAIPGGGSLFETTLSANIKIDNLMIIPEFRVENASKEIYSKSNGTPTKTMGDFLIAAVYKF